jgi:CheY-like chemotaxis protein
MSSRILIADDYDDNRELLRLILLGAAYDVREARDGGECLMLAKEQAPDLMLIDLSMPVLDGWHVFKELRADQRTRDIPCIAVTAYAEVDRQRALEAGFNAFLAKPFRTEELLDMVKQLLAAGAERAGAAEAGLLGGEA